MEGLTMLNRSFTTIAALMLVAASAGAQQRTSQARIPVTKDGAKSSSGEVVATPKMPAATSMADTTPMMMDTLAIAWYRPTGTVCSTVDANAARAVKIKTDMYDPATMISPDSAKIVALCAVP